ncbi:MAG: hypothetical protein F4117_09615 [Acidimicrobiales bacterium]|nr:hypothetical protein [Acidimicrobiales bacterium]MXX43315.1 hypothetical protein [Acidimicrobiales bacterium]MXY02132.1 hypothetical protein [Acidimicrobiales bacterium]MYA25436.1 hypothetical protein [Acidimicrobiales bacterium]MYB82509.1 hypothetical protein [Acidimicrobiales bacterium]
MSEEDRSRLYAWLREQTDEPLAEYLMSCLPAAPLSDLVTKQHLEAVLSAEFSAFELRMAEQREADRRTLDQRLRRLAIALPVELVAALAAVTAVTEWLRG